MVWNNNEEVARLYSILCKKISISEKEHEPAFINVFDGFPGAAMCWPPGAGKRSVTVSTRPNKTGNCRLFGCIIKWDTPSLSSFSLCWDVRFSLFLLLHVCVCVCVCVLAFCLCSTAKRITFQLMKERNELAAFVYSRERERETAKVNRWLGTINNFSTRLFTPRGLAMPYLTGTSWDG